MFLSLGIIFTIMIKQLDEQTINKIAAGEVIDRPSSIIKECVENSLDAGASSIEVDVYEGGIKSIKIKDNGCGISKEDLSLAPIRHATSKINVLEDIYSTLSMGFRGEALASICHVAKTSIQSRTQESDRAYGIFAYCGSISEVKEVSHSIGTTIECRDLFLDIPVRRQYLKSASSELSRIKQQLVPIMLIHPNIDIVLRSEGREELSSVGIDRISVLMQQLIDKKCWNHCVEISKDLGGLRVEGVITDPQVNFSNRKKQFVAVNDRLVSHPAISKIISDVYKDVIPQGRFPACVINIAIDPSQIDVNIHPKKEEIKFLQTEILFKSLPRALRETFSKQHDVFVAPINHSLHPSSVSPEVTYHPAQPSSHSTAVNMSAEFTPPSNTANTLNKIETPTVSPTKVHAEDIAIRYDDPERVMTIESPILYEEKRPTNGLVLDYFQMFDTYIILKTVDKLWVLDQHAVHERILYEEIKSNQSNCIDDVQLLLVPHYISVDHEQLEAFEIIKPWLDTLNVDAEVFGNDKICVRQCPVIFSDCNLGEWITDLLNLAGEFGVVPEKAPYTKEKWQMQACKAAIKAGKKMALSEVKELCELFVNSPSNFTCPHGRPLFKQFEKSDLEKWFERI